MSTAKEIGILPTGIFADHTLFAGLQRMVVGPPGCATLVGTTGVALRGVLWISGENSLGCKLLKDEVLLPEHSRHQPLGKTGRLVNSGHIAIRKRWQRRRAQRQARPRRTKGRSCPLASCFCGPCARLRAHGLRVEHFGRIRRRASCDVTVRAATGFSARPYAPSREVDPSHHRTEVGLPDRRGAVGEYMQVFVWPLTDLSRRCAATIRAVRHR